MKKIITSILLLLSFISLAYSQCNDFYRQTPKGTNIKACTDGGYPDWLVLQIDQQTRAYAIYVFEGEIILIIVMQMPGMYLKEETKFG